jgi:hypothetical protein
MQLASTPPAEKQTAPAPATPWLLPAARNEHLAVSSDAVKLFCVPQAGMGTWVYQRWQQQLAPGIQVRARGGGCALHLPMAMTAAARQPSHTCNSCTYCPGGHSESTGLQGSRRSPPAD